MLLHNRICSSHIILIYSCIHSLRLDWLYPTLFPMRTHRCHQGQQRLHLKFFSRTIPRIIVNKPYKHVMLLYLLLHNIQVVIICGNCLSMNHTIGCFPLNGKVVPFQKHAVLPLALKMTPQYPPRGVPRPHFNGYGDGVTSSISPHPPNLGHPTVHASGSCSGSRYLPSSLHSTLLHPVVHNQRNYKLWVRISTLVQQESQTGKVWDRKQVMVFTSPRILNRNTINFY